MPILNSLQHSARDHAISFDDTVRSLMADLGVSISSETSAEGTHHAARWASSGLMHLVGEAGSRPALCPVPLATRADACLDTFRVLSRANVLSGTRGSQLLSERAAISGEKPDGRISAGGSCRLMASADGCIGLSLARPEDWELVPAWLQQDFPADWHSVTTRISTLKTQYLVQRGRLLGLAVADATVIPTAKTAWYELQPLGHAGEKRREVPRVLDLSSLWAGPLCSHLWQLAGAEVIKLESSRRPDGARRGSPRFFDLLNRGKQSLTLELHTREGQQALMDLIQQVDILLEGSRPRALQQMGIHAADLLDANPGLSWVSITGYGRKEPQCNWVAYGDDAGIAAGLSAILYEATGKWRICGDAIADPLTGLHAAVAGWASWLAGGGNLVELSLEQTVRHCITTSPPADNNYLERQKSWMCYLRDNQVETRAPQCRSEELSSAP